MTMKVFIIFVRDENLYNVLPDKLRQFTSDDTRFKVMAYPPLGIQTLAPIVRQRGHQVRLFDTCHPQMKTEHIVRAIQKEQPGAIALSILSTIPYPNAKGMVRQFKLAAPHIPIIFGGVFASMNAVHILKDCTDVDCVGVGEGEELLPDFLDNLSDPGKVAGLVWRNGDEIVKNEPRPLIEDLDQYPYPERSSLPIDYIEAMLLHTPAPLSYDKFCTIQTSRGCPFNCVYCDIPAYSNRRWRYRSAEHVLGEMQALNDKGYRSINLTDDHFLLNRKRIKEICNGIIERKLAFRWSCEGRVDSKAIDQFALMKKANCKSLSFGIEAGAQKTLDRLGKRQTLNQIEHAVSEAKAKGISHIHGFFLVGTPDETEDDLLENFRFAARLKIDTFNFSRLCVYRGTPLWKEYVERGIIDDERDWYKWFKCSDIDPTVLPTDALQRIRRKGFALLFARRIIGRPIQTLKLIRSLSRHMTLVDIFKLIASAFSSPPLHRKPDLPAKMIDFGIEKPSLRRELMM